METSQPLTTESFSYSWLINQKPSLDHIFENNTNSIVNSRRASEETQNFCFDLPYAAANLVDADQIFRNGRIVPKSVNQMKLFSCPATPMVQIIQKDPSSYTKKYSQLIADWRISTRKVLRKCFSFLVPRRRTRIVDRSRNSVCISSSKITNEQTNTRIDVYETTSRRTKSWSHCDYNEESVHEAIVHCKKSFGSIS